MVSEICHRQQCTVPQALLECRRSIGEVHAETQVSNENAYVQIFRNKDVHLLALFAFMYVGVEVAIGGTSAVDATATKLTARVRLDCFLYDRNSSWRTFVRVHIFGLLRR